MPGHIDYLGPFEEFIDEGLQQRLARLGDEDSDIRITGDGIDYRLGQCREWKTTELGYLESPEIIRNCLLNELGRDINDDLSRIRVVRITDVDIAVFADGYFRFSLREKE